MESKPETSPEAAGAPRAAAPPPPVPAAAVRTLLRQGPFTRYITGEGISMTGTWMQVMAQSWVMTGLTDKAVMLGMVNFAASIPMIALSMVGGTFADRYSKRNILLLTQVVQITCAVLLGWLVGTGHIHIWHILTIAFCLGISGAFEMPAASALVPELVGQDQIATAISFDRAVFHGTRLIGPGLAGYVISLWGPSSAFYANAFSFVALIAALFTIRPHATTPEAAKASSRGGMREGFAYVRSDRPTLAMIGLLSTTVICVFPVPTVMTPLYARNVLGLGPDKMGLLMGLSASGSLAGALSLLGVPRRHRRGLLFGAVGGISLALTGLALAHRFSVAAVSLIALSLGISTLAGLSQTIVQERAPGPLRGRVSAIVGLSFFGLMPFAALGITSVSDGLGMRRALVLAALAYLAVATTVLIRAGPHLREPKAGS